MTVRPRPRPVEAGANIEGETPVVEHTVETDEATITEDAERERGVSTSGPNSRPARPPWKRSSWPSPSAPSSFVHREREEG